MRRRRHDLRLDSCNLVEEREQRRLLGVVRAVTDVEVASLREECLGLVSRLNSAQTECGPGLGCTYSQSQQGRASTRAEHFVLNTTLVQQLHAPPQTAARTT